MAPAISIEKLQVHRCLIGSVCSITKINGMRSMRPLSNRLANLQQRQSLAVRCIHDSRDNRSGDGRGPQDKGQRRDDRTGEVKNRVFSGLPPRLRVTKHASNNFGNIVRPYRVPDKPGEISSISVPPVTPKASLVEQLFPEETRNFEARKGAQQSAQREVPRIPVTEDKIEQKAGEEDHFEKLINSGQSSSLRRKKQRALATRQYVDERRGRLSHVLLLNYASPNLTEEDFRRLIPQGRYIEGWTLEVGDIIKVIPRRDRKTLARNGSYYLIFSSSTSAATFMDHALKIHDIAAANAQGSYASPIPAPPGVLQEGIDVDSAIQAYALVPPQQKLHIQHLFKPLDWRTAKVIEDEGYPALVHRKDRSPVEVRMTLEGPQVSLLAIHHQLVESGTARGLSWTGETGRVLKIREWDDSKLRRGDFDLEDQDQQEGSEQAFRPESHSRSPRRTPNPVYIVGFPTEHAAESFTGYWHRRPLPLDGTFPEDEQGDPPIVNAELLW